MLLRVIRITIIAALSAALLFLSAKIIVENSRIRQTIVIQQGLLAKAAVEKKALEKEAAQLKREIGELRAQKALYTATLETLAKK